MDKGKNTGIMAVIMVFILLVVSLISYIIYDKVTNKNKVEEKQEEKTIEINNSNNQKPVNSQQTINNSEEQNSNQQTINTDESINSLSDDWQKLNILEGGYMATSSTQFKLFNDDGNLTYESKMYNSLRNVSGFNGIAIIDDQTLKLIDDAENEIATLATLPNTNYNIHNAQWISTSDRLCNVSQNGVYVFFSNGLNGNEEKLYVVYYNPDNGEKSELVEADASGSYGNLVTCK